jgi:predicted Fe-Mo cluster-binding NifX family protein
MTEDTEVNESKTTEDAKPKKYKKETFYTVTLDDVKVVVVSSYTVTPVKTWALKEAGVSVSMSSTKEVVEAIREGTLIDLKD